MKNKDKTFRIKTGVFARDFISPNTIDILVKKISDYPGFKFEVYTSLPGSRLNGGRPNTYVIDGDCIYPLGSNHKRVRVESNDALCRAADIVLGKYSENSGYFQDRQKVVQLLERSFNNPEDNCIESLEEKFQKSIEILNQSGIAVNLALTNHFVDDADLEDPYFQRAIDFLASQNQGKLKNSVTYVNDKLAEFVKSRYGKKLGLTASIIKFCAQPDLTYQEALKTADDVVLFHGDVFNDEILKSIPEDKRKNVFIMANTGCKLQCSKKSANEHYLHASMFNRGEIEKFERSGCEIGGRPCGPDIKRFEKLIDLGYISYKFVRSSTLEMQSLLSLIGPHAYLGMPSILSHLKNKGKVEEGK